MGVEKKVMVLWVCAMVVSSMLMEHGAAAAINYTGLGGRRQNLCGLHDDKCEGRACNYYNRRCQESQRYGGGGGGRKLMAIVH
ncbi:hypothetical protein V6N13_014808 [Hibiscus sabdariffa]